MYDFILFENYHLAYNHYKDVCIVAEYLKANSYSVAIADVFGEGDNCHVQGIPHIKISRRNPVDLERLLSRKTGFCSRIIHYFDLLRINKYLRQVMRELRGQYKHLYLGSYYTTMDTNWLQEIPESSCAFFWGLRSARLIENSRKAKRLKAYFDTHTNLKFFVSDQIIFKEFKALGISDDRLVIRPERYIREISSFQRKDKDGTIRLLTIGSIRRQKCVEKCLEALKLCSGYRIEYTIAGKTTEEDYEKIIEEHSKGLNNVRRLNYRLPESEYNNLIENSDFLVLCDEQQQSSVTNGTMNEALLKGKPIVAPDYNPYKFFVEKYGIGILYDYNSVNSLASAIKNANEKGSNSFMKNISQYQETLLFSTISAQFGKDIADCIK